MILCSCAYVHLGFYAEEDSEQVILSSKTSRGQGD